MIRAVLVGLAGLASACSAPALPAEPLPEGVERVARFADARALATDGAGRLYVADAGASEVVVLDTHGVVLDRLGGTDDQPFLDLADVDPTNGQAIFVADAGTGRIVRFTAEGRAAEVLDVPRLLDADAPARAGEGSGRPIAVAAGPGNVVYAIEAERGVVLRWGADRQLDRVIGGPASPTPLRAPTALAVRDDGSLIVADGDRLVVFDAFGAVQEVRPKEAGQAVYLTREGVLEADAAGLRQLDGAELLNVELAMDLVDVAVVGAWAYGLTRTRLVRARASTGRFAR